LADGVVDLDPDGIDGADWVCHRHAAMQVGKTIFCVATRRRAATQMNAIRINTAWLAGRRL
jgi:hypothetical protein